MSDAIQKAAHRLFHTPVHCQPNALNCLSAELRKAGALRADDWLDSWEMQAGPKIYAESQHGAEFTIFVETGAFNHC